MAPTSSEEVEISSYAFVYACTKHRLTEKEGKQLHQRKKIRFYVKKVSFFLYFEQALAMTGKILLSFFFFLTFHFNTKALKENIVLQSLYSTGVSFQSPVELIQKR